MQGSLSGFKSYMLEHYRYQAIIVPRYVLFLEADIDIKLTEFYLRRILVLRRVCVWIIILRSVWEICDFNQLLQEKLILCFFQRDINCAENALTDIYHFDVEIRDNEKVMGL